MFKISFKGRGQAARAWPHVSHGWVGGVEGSLAEFSDNVSRVLGFPLCLPQDTYPLHGRGHRHPQDKKEPRICNAILSWTCILSDRPFTEIVHVSLPFSIRLDLDLYLTRSHTTGQPLAQVCIEKRRCNVRQMRAPLETMGSMACHSVHKAKPNKHNSAHLSINASV